MTAPRPKQPVGEWVAVKERNPKERGRYLTYSDGLLEMRIANYGTSRKWDNGRDKLASKTYRITHWMELPEPPK